MNVIRSHYTEKINKVALCCEDDKRHILSDNINILWLWGIGKLFEKIIFLIEKSCKDESRIERRLWIRFNFSLNNANEPKASLRCLINGEPKPTFLFKYLYIKEKCSITF